MYVDALKVIIKFKKLNKRSDKYPFICTHSKQIDR